jgi:multidrug resistance protein, MATE family
MPARYLQELRELWKLALPIAIAQAGQALMGFVDTAVCGRAGTTTLAAVSLANNLFFAVAAFAIGLLLGIDPLISQAFGAQNPHRARSLLWQGAYLALAVGSLLALPIAVGPLFLPTLGVQIEELAEVQGYLLWRAPSLPFVLLFVSTRAYLQAAARPGSLVVATLVANLVNLGADILFVFGGTVLPESFGPLRSLPAMGASGAALASFLCSILQWVLISLDVRNIRLPSGSFSRRPVRADMAQALSVGLPIGLHVAAEVGVFVLVGVLARVLGPESISAHQIALTYSSLSFTVAMGIGNAGSVRVGWAVGARDTPQARLSGRTAMAAGAGFMCLSALAFALFPLPLVQFMGAPAEVLPLAIPLMAVAALFQIFDGVQGVGAGILRGAGDTRFTFIANVVGHWLVGLPVALLLGFSFHLGVTGLWWGLCLGLISVSFALVWRFEHLAARPLRPLEA